MLFKILSLKGQCLISYQQKLTSMLFYVLSYLSYLSYSVYCSFCLDFWSTDNEASLYVDWATVSSSLFQGLFMSQLSSVVQLCVCFCLTNSSTLTFSLSTLK